MWTRLGLIVACAGAVACGVDDVPFRCDSDAECVDGSEQGVCERAGYCAFPDPKCPTQRRYAKLAPDGLGNACVPNCVQGLSLGRAHACAVLSSGLVQCWGAAAGGRLGDGTTQGSIASPVIAGGASLRATIVAAGGAHTCVVLQDDNSVWCWGDNSSRQLGVEQPGPGPHRVGAFDGAGAPITEGEAGEAFTCGRAAIGTACWGANQRGQLGNGDFGLPQPPSLVPFKNGFVEVAVGEAHACGRTIAGTTHCWGDNSGLQVGQQDEQIPYPTPVLLQPAPRAASLSLGLQHSCMVTTEERVECWGNNFIAGQLGKSQLVKQSRIPLRIQLPAPAVAVTAGLTHNCALTADGKAYCWGGNEFGQLGPNQKISPVEPDPVPVELPGGIAKLYAGGLFTCALTNLDVVYCWGANESGQLGNGALEPDGRAQPDRTVSSALACP